MSEEFLIQWINDNFDGINGELSSIVDLLTLSPKDFNSTIWNTMINIFNAILPVALTILSILFAITLIEKMMRVDMNVDFDTIFKIILYFVIAKVVMSNCFNILEIILSTNKVLLDKVNLSVTVSENSTLSEQLIEYVKNDISGSINRLGFYMQYMVPALLLKILSLIVSVIVYGRFIQLFTLTALAPLPIACIGNEKTRHITLRFVQEYIAVCLQGLVILIAVYIYMSMLSSFDMQGGLSEVVWGTIKISIIIVMALFSSGGVARKIVGAG